MRTIVAAALLLGACTSQPEALDRVAPACKPREVAPASNLCRRINVRPYTHGEQIAVDTALAHSPSVMEYVVADYITLRDQVFRACRR